MPFTKYILYLLVALLMLFLIGYLMRTAVLIHRTNILIKNSRPYEQSPNPSNMTILIVGDSTAVGTGSNTPEESIAGRFGALYPDATIINEGINGQKIAELAQNFNHHHLQKADLVIIQIGANDIIQFTPVNEVRMNLDSLLEKARKISNKVVILHGGNVGNAPIFPPLLSFIWDNRTKAFRDLYKDEVPKLGGTYVDLYQSRENDIFLTDPQKYYAADMFHPSSDGYKVWFDKIILTLSE